MIASSEMEYIGRRMAELGHSHYHVREMHLVLWPGQVEKIAATLQLLLLTAPVSGINIESQAGIFDLFASAAVLQYEHQGEITITNYSALIQHVRFIQVTFKAK